MRTRFLNGTRYVTGFLFAVIVGGGLYVYATEISNVTVTNITDSSATVEWKTDVSTDATINFGLDERVGIVRYPQFDKKQHSLVIDNLDPSTTYHFRVVSSDVDGNTNATAGFVFTTKKNDTRPAPKIKKIEDEIEEVIDPEELKQLKEKLAEVTIDKVQPPSIIGAPNVIAESDRATISWVTDRPSNSLVSFATDAEYKPSAKDPYTLTQGDAKEMVTKHTVTVIGLESSTLYHFQASSEDDLGLIGISEDGTFRTKSTLPEIGRVRVTKVQEHSATISWDNGGVKAKGIVEYTNTKTKAKKVAGNPVYATSHTVQLADLDFGVRYSAVIRAMNEAGEEVSSQPVTFVTVRDVVAPVISKVTNESTLFPSEEVKIQTFISWQTDEPSLCQVQYAQGVAQASGEGTESLPYETNPVTLHTQVIVGFAPATVYQFWMVCKDEAGNESRSEDFVLITPVKEKSIIDIILENFEGTFGWVKNIAQ